MRQSCLTGLQIVCLTFGLAAAALAEDKPPADASSPAAVEETCKRTTFKVLIDVGHTPDDPGAISAHGNPEYGYNLNLANMAMTQLVDAGFRQTALILVKGRGYGQLLQRAQIANRV